MRKAIIAVLSVILAFAAAIPVFSAKKPDFNINGYIENNEWIDAEKEEISLDYDELNDLKYKKIISRYYVDETDSVIYYSIAVTSGSANAQESGTDYRRITITMPNGSQYTLDDSGEKNDADYEIVYSCRKNNKPCEFYFEMAVIFLNTGWNEKDVSVKYLLYDDNGTPVPEKVITVPFGHQNNPEEYGTTDSSGSKTTKASKTTTEKSTKPTTQKLTGGSRVPTTRRGVTTSAATTTKKPTEPQTTAAKTTSAKVRTTKAKTTRTRTTKAQSSRETASYAAGTGETTVVYMLDAEALSALINTTTAQTQADRSAFGIKTIPRSTLLKGVTAAAALILFGIIGAWAVKSRSDDDESPKDEKEDSGDKADNNEKED